MDLTKAQRQTHQQKQATNKHTNGNARRAGGWAAGGRMTKRIRPVFGLIRGSSGRSFFTDCSMKGRQGRPPQHMIEH